MRQETECWASSSNRDFYPHNHQNRAARDFYPSNDEFIIVIDAEEFSINMELYAFDGKCGLNCEIVIDSNYIL